MGGKKNRDSIISNKMYVGRQIFSIRYKRVYERKLAANVARRTFQIRSDVASSSPSVLSRTLAPMNTKLCILHPSPTEETRAPELCPPGKKPPRKLSLTQVS